MPRQRLRPTRREPGSTQPSRQDDSTPSAAAPSRPSTSSARPSQSRKPKPQWRETIDSFGGFLTVGAIVVAIGIVVAIFVMNGNKETTTRDVSTKEQVGTAVAVNNADTDRLHVSDPARLEIPADGLIPVRGPHYAVPQSVGVYDTPVPDGNAIHALEHGIVWLSYNADKLGEDGIKQLEALGKQYSVDTIVSPRPLDSTAIEAGSWGYRLTLDSFDKTQLEDFIKTNRNRSPEPFVR